MADVDQIRRRIEARISQGEFLASMLQVARQRSSTVQEDFVAQLSSIAARMRGVLETNDCIQRLQYRPNHYWPSIRGQSIAFLDGGVANIELPSAAPIGIRVGSYIVRPGESDPARREQFNIELSLVDDLYDAEGGPYEDAFLDTAKLRDAARIVYETAALWHLAGAVQGPDVAILHGPLVNPAAPYGLEDFPAFSLEACRTLLADDDWQGDENDRQFVGLYLTLLERIKDSGKTAIGVVERSLGKEPVVANRLLTKLQNTGVIPKREAQDLFDQIKQYGLNDASLFDVVLQEGEYLEPVAVMRQGPENKWPEPWKRWIRDYPDALTTYLKPSELVSPFRVEGLETTPRFKEALDLVLHTSRLLPSYGFPVGLDIVDKFAKVPAWMSRGVRGQHQVVLLQKAFASGDPNALTFAKRVLAAKGRDWLFRPSV